MLLWVKPGTAPSYAVMAEMPRGHNTLNDVRAAYLEEKQLNKCSSTKHAEPSLSITLPENACALQRYLCTCVIGSVEALEVLMGFHQYQMTRQVIFFAN